MSKPSSVLVAICIKGGEAGAAKYADAFAAQEGIPRDALTVSRIPGGFFVVSVIASALDELPQLRQDLIAQWMPLREPVGRDD